MTRGSVSMQTTQTTLAEGHYLCMISIQWQIAGIPRIASSPFSHVLFSFQPDCVSEQY